MWKVFKKIFLIVLFIFSTKSTRLVGQVNTSDSTSLASDKKTQIDIADLYKLAFKKNISIQPDSSKKKSLGPFYTPLPYPGYAMVTGYLIGLSNSVSFYTNRSEDAKISTISLNDVYSQYQQSINILNSNIWLSSDKINLQGDWRYYKFPTNTFGLGSKTSLNDVNAVDYSHLKIDQNIMRKITGNFLGGLGVNYDYHWNVNETNKSTNIVTDLDKYGFNKTSVSSGITLNLQFDNRINSNNPSNGAFVNFQIRNNFKAIGSTTKWKSMTLDARYYIQTSKKSGNVLAFWSYNWLTLSGIPPYFDLPTTGLDAYDNTARGYVEGRFRGLNLIYAEAEYRFRLTKNGLLGGVLFSNASTLTEWPSNKFEKINPGNGVGLRIKMNKKSNSNLCIDYAIGTGGSRGFAFNLNEVF